VCVVAVGACLGSERATAQPAADGPSQTPSTIASMRRRPQSSAPATGSGKVHRWLDWQAGTLDARYRWIENSTGATTTNHLQDRQSARLGFKFDRQGKYSVQTFVGTGSSFTGSWDPLGPGTGTRTFDLNVRHLYLAAAPLKGLDGQVGGLGILRGEQTEITSFDNDGFMIGERVTIKRPARIYLDELSVTAGFIGDLTTPNVFRRLDRLDDHNYTQVLAAKRLGSIVSLSADWTSLSGISTLRQAVRVTTRPWAPVDAVRFEQYERVEGSKAYGFAVSAERALTKRLGISGGFCDIDPNYGALNGDRFGRGQRVFTESRLTLLPELTLTTYYGVAVHNDFPVSNRHRLDIVASWNVLKTVQKTGIW
jgi:hypothetical protein